MVGQYEELSCPFCDKGIIPCLYIPSTKSVKTRSTATFGRTKSYSRNPDVWIIKAGCPICGKSEEEVEKELKRKGVI